MFFEATLRGIGVTDAQTANFLLVMMALEEESHHRLMQNGTVKDRQQHELRRAKLESLIELNDSIELMSTVASLAAQALGVFEDPAKVLTKMPDNWAARSRMLEAVCERVHEARNAGQVERRTGYGD